VATHKHLRRLDSVWVPSPVYFVTVCAAERRPVLGNQRIFQILREEFEAAPARSGWSVGRYVVMPDHVHFFCVSEEAASSASLSRFIGGFKQWTAKRALHAMGLVPPFRQKQFFDRLLRSDESYQSKWLYVGDNPVRAGFVTAAGDWPDAGEIATIMR